MIKYCIFTLVCGLALCLNSCNVTCEYTCEEPVSSISETSTAKVSRSKCDDCDFARVNTWELAGYDCTCKEE